mgnify:FL=1
MLNCFFFDNSSPILPLGPTTTDIKFDHNSSSSMMDQFMVGHGFNSEVAQNRNMASVFDSNSSNNSPKAQRSEQISSSLNSQQNYSTDAPVLGKKVEHRRKKHRSFLSKIIFRH